MMELLQWMNAGSSPGGSVGFVGAVEVVVVAVVVVVTVVVVVVGGAAANHFIEFNKHASPW